MSEDTPSKKTLIEQIYDEFLASVEISQEFDNTSIEGLRGLIARGELKQPKTVTAAIVPRRKEDNEASRAGN